MNIANRLTFSRILFIPIFLFAFFVQFKYHLLIAGIIFFLSGLTDLFDGYIARTYNQVSELGRLLDPLADKLTMIAVFIALAVNQLIPIWILIVVITREFIILFGAILVYLNKADIISPSKFGKYATFFLYVTAFAYIIKWRLFQYATVLAIPFTVISGVDYCIKAYNNFSNG
ncbi:MULTISPECIES: CDP-diacylglycerol--glycerol-3-phosphate 3-phosphatidyltransferase [unclassified Candidatus Frackibacter]|uniref:CDP-diacylglycerol--glycerol-3-phosphate 3-phosphatidyltransferase n=1 Tax=unclassified Candidatus Frackibacter TaxID=2648818 RepID=UPI000883E8D5|nr:MULTISPECIES: CDP-diacylglycerol--glycerol-3-phosphate 3-phosphatidyltransferase [unclassified Candidatus Frackibacter]SDC61794.1 CDP-diacylglycerol--glycerol-3-phosphate 3-phosphatidyltransferase [Candidatus Frackibacter sp. WG11]SEM75563.1 CDP-diacylglycerol--glycerol-3-phosphate 3-phosphatidyltransferase [Candidatus Frackibacter sp. WG12]SFL86706.1 CDP-diacylglycerol--glycerol-3-phosphate 3-phosphatidyltransferase [Candidatus Frackibacter sp. WG13]